MTPRPQVWLLASAVAALVLAHQGWWTVTAEGVTVRLTGAEASAGLAQALPVVALVGLLATLTLRAFGRRVVALLVGAAFLGVVALGLAHPEPSEADVLDRVRRVSLADSYELAPGWAPWAYAAAGVFGVAASGWLVAVPVTKASRSVRERPDEVADPADSWKAMDDGIDPTALPGEPHQEGHP